MSGSPHSARRGQSPRWDSYGQSKNRACQSNASMQDEIDALKKQKQELLEEKRLLRAKLTRMSHQSSKSQRSATLNPAVYRQLQNNQAALEKMVENQHRKVDELRHSDQAALRSELIEEAKIIYQERIRLQRYQSEKHQELLQTRKELEELEETHGSHVFEKQERSIVAYQDKIEKYKHANQIIEAKIEKVASASNQQSNLQSQEIVKRKKDLDAQIQKVREAIAQNEAAIQKSNEDHENLMKSLRESLQKDSSN